MLAGKNVAPCFQRLAPIVSIIQIGRLGSSIAMPIFANVIAPGTDRTGLRLLLEA